MIIKDSILNLLKKSDYWSIKQMVDELMVSKQAVHYAINQLLEENKIIRLGKPPKTIYKLKPKEENIDNDAIIKSISDEDQQLLNQHFLNITELGKIMQGAEAFVYWCESRKLPVLKTLDEYKTTIKKYNTYKNEWGLIDGMQKIKNTDGYEKIWLDALFYIDFYAIERFGKTKLGILLHFAKQGQNKFLMKKLLDEIKNKIDVFISKVNADAIAFVPPTIRREVQIMKFLQTNTKINLPLVGIQKISGIIPVPQKSLNKLNERINNANDTFSITETRKYKHVILIDDAVGSGATLNQIAAKLKQKKIAQKVTGMAIVGSFKGFDVITDI